MIHSMPSYAPEKYRRKKESIRKLERCVKFLAIILPIVILVLGALLPNLWILHLEGEPLQKDWLLIGTVCIVTFFIMIVMAGFLHISYMQALHEYLIAKEKDPKKRAELYNRYKKGA